MDIHVFVFHTQAAQVGLCITSDKLSLFCTYVYKLCKPLTAFFSLLVINKLNGGIAFSPHVYSWSWRGHEQLFCRLNSGWHYRAVLFCRSICIEYMHINIYGVHPSQIFFIYKGNLVHTVYWCAIIFFKLFWEYQGINGCNILTKDIFRTASFIF
jgi:hypothetical protein